MAVLGWMLTRVGWSCTLVVQCAAGVAGYLPVDRRDELRPSEPGNPKHILLEHVFRNTPWWTGPGAGCRARIPTRTSSTFTCLPAFPEVRTRLARVAADVVRRYQVDGVHLGLTRYLGREWSYDRADAF